MYPSGEPRFSTETVEIYTPGSTVASVWREVAPLHFPRRGMGSVVIAGLLFASGGTSSDFAATTEILNITSMLKGNGSWIFGPPLEDARDGLGLAATGYGAVPNRICAFSGFGSNMVANRNLNTTECLQLDNFTAYSY
jgi:hypothetical protein